MEPSTSEKEWESAISRSSQITGGTEVVVATVVSGAAVVGVEVAVVDTLSDWTTAA